MGDPVHAKWYRHGGTWFAGVNVMPNNERGALPGGPPLSGPCIDFIHAVVGMQSIVWDRGQLSVCFPGYPQPMDGEPEASFQYRVKRDAAHVDGVHASGSPRRRFLREHHAFILGIPLDRVEHDLSPLVVWEGSHQLMKRALRGALADMPPEHWQLRDITEVYHAARREAFNVCPRTEVVTKPGQTYLLHRLMLHGIAPWTSHISSQPKRRAIVYFRPTLPNKRDWLFAP